MIVRYKGRWKLQNKNKNNSSTLFLFFQIRPVERRSIRINRRVRIVLLNDVNEFTNILVTNSFRKRSKRRRFVPFVRNFFGKKQTKIQEKKIFTFFFSRGFAYQGFQCQRCDCVVHRTCYNRYACPCNGKKYSEVNFSMINVFVFDVFFFLQLANAGIAHHFEQQPFSLKPLFCDHCGSFIRPGHVHRCSCTIDKKRIFLLIVVVFVLDCVLIVHRRCMAKVGNFCGCEDNLSALYEKWKESVRQRRKNAFECQSLKFNLKNRSEIWDFFRLRLRFLRNVFLCRYAF